MNWVLFSLVLSVFIIKINTKSINYLDDNNIKQRVSRDLSYYSNPYLPQQQQQQQFLSYQQYQPRIQQYQPRNSYHYQNYMQFPQIHQQQLQQFPQFQQPTYNYQFQQQQQPLVQQVSQPTYDYSYQQQQPQQPIIQQQQPQEYQYYNEQPQQLQQQPQDFQYYNEQPLETQQPFRLDYNSLVSMNNDNSDNSFVNNEDNELKAITITKPNYLQLNNQQQLQQQDNNLPINTIDQIFDSEGSEDEFIMEPVELVQQQQEPQLQAWNMNVPNKQSSSSSLSVSQQQQQQPQLQTWNNNMPNRPISTQQTQQSWNMNAPSKQPSMPLVQQQQQQGQVLQFPENGQLTVDYNGNEEELNEYDENYDDSSLFNNKLPIKVNTISGPLLNNLPKQQQQQQQPSQLNNRPVVVQQVQEKLPQVQMNRPVQAQQWQPLNVQQQESLKDNNDVMIPMNVLTLPSMNSGKHEEMDDNHSSIIEELPLDQQLPFNMLSIPNLQVASNRPASLSNRPNNNPNTIVQQQQQQQKQRPISQLRPNNNLNPMQSSSSNEQINMAKRPSNNGNVGIQWQQSQQQRPSNNQVTMTQLPVDNEVGQQWQQQRPINQLSTNQQSRPNSSLTLVQLPSFNEQGITDNRQSESQWQQQVNFVSQQQQQQQQQRPTSNQVAMSQLPLNNGNNDLRPEENIEAGQQWQQAQVPSNMRPSNSMNAGSQLQPQQQQQQQPIVQLVRPNTNLSLVQLPSSNEQMVNRPSSNSNVGAQWQQPQLPVNPVNSQQQRPTNVQVTMTQLPVENNINSLRPVIISGTSNNGNVGEQLQQQRPLNNQNTMTQLPVDNEVGQQWQQAQVPSNMRPSNSMNAGSQWQPQQQQQQQQPIVQLVRPNTNLSLVQLPSSNEQMNMVNRPSNIGNVGVQWQQPQLPSNMNQLAVNNQQTQEIKPNVLSTQNQETMLPFNILAQSQQFGNYYDEDYNEHDDNSELNKQELMENNLQQHQQQQQQQQQLSQDDKIKKALFLLNKLNEKLLIKQQQQQQQPFNLQSIDQQMPLEKEQQVINDENNYYDYNEEYNYDKDEQQLSYNSPSSKLNLIQPLSYNNQQQQQIVNKIPSLELIPIIVNNGNVKETSLIDTNKCGINGKLEYIIETTTINSLEDNKNELIKEEKEIKTEEYCRCEDSISYSLDGCINLLENPCIINLTLNETQQQQFFEADLSLPKSYFIHCSWNIPYLKKCSSNLIWNQSIKTCDWPSEEGNSQN